MLWTVLLVVAAAGALCVAYGVLIEHHWFRLRRYRLDILPTANSGPAELSILHLSDLHFTRHDRKKARFLASLPRADITVITGDFLTEHGDTIEFAVETVRPTRGRLASYFVLGSNDHYVSRPINYLRYFFKERKRASGIHGRRDDLIAQLEADGWIHLQNIRRDEVLGDEGAIEVVGLDDPHIHRDDITVAPRLHPERFGLAVVHAPDPGPELAALGYDLIVAGHTHGGQVRLPFIGAIVNNSELPTSSFSMGLIDLGSSYLHISPGIGTSKYAPFRFLCRPEATMLDMRPARVPLREPIST